MFARQPTSFNNRGLFLSLPSNILQERVQRNLPTFLYKRYSRFGCEPESSSGGPGSYIQPDYLKHWWKNWHASRRNKLTASTFAGAIGFWPGRRAQLWQEKIGAIEPFSGNSATFWSNIKEEEALERYKLITGNTISHPEFEIYNRKNPEDDWLAASPDGVIDQLCYGLPSRGVLEIKCPFYDGNKEIAYPWTRIPNYCIPQAQGLLEILDRDWMDFYVWTINGSSLFRINRDRLYWEQMELALSDFWFNHVLPAKEICSKSLITNPFIELKSLRPAPRHELCPAIVYHSKCVVDDSKLVMREIKGVWQPDAYSNVPSSALYEAEYLGFAERATR